MLLKKFRPGPEEPAPRRDTKVILEPRGLRLRPEPVARFRMLVVRLNLVAQGTIPWRKP